MHPKLAKASSEYPSFEEIGKRIPRDILLKYLTRPRSSSFAHNFVKILNSHREPSLLIKGIELHELKELDVFREQGSLEKILGGMSNTGVIDTELGLREKNYYLEADSIAKLAELTFYQKMGEIMFGKKIPFSALRCATYANPIVAKTVKPYEINDEIRNLNRKDLLVPFNLDDVLLAVNLFELGGDDVSQLYRSIRIARDVENFVLEKDFFPESPANTVSETNLNITSDSNQNIVVLEYGIRYADIKNRIFAGWLKYKMKNDTHLDEWISYTYQFKQPQTIFLGISIPSYEAKYLVNFLADFIDSRIRTHFLEKRSIHKNSVKHVSNLRGEKGLMFKPYSQPYITIFGYGIKYADIQHDVFSGWIKYSIKNKEEPRTHIDNWITFKSPFYTPDWAYYVRPFCGVTFGEGFLDFQIDAFCVEQLGLRKPIKTPKKLGYLY